MWDKKSNEVTAHTKMFLSQLNYCSCFAVEIVLVYFNFFLNCVCLVFFSIQYCMYLIVTALISEYKKLTRKLTSFDFVTKYENF